MRLSERDEDQLHTIMRYCLRLEEAIERFGRNFETFESDVVYQDSCSLCIIQIGEAVNRLSDEFIAAHPQIDWRRIYGMRCHLVHGYESFDAEIVWDAIQRCVPPLRSFCEQYVVD